MASTHRIWFLTPLFIGFLGALPHILFSIDVGEFSFLKSAWDEDFYVLRALDDVSYLHRTFSQFVIQKLTALNSGNVDIMLVMIDVLVPVLATVLSIFIVRRAGIEKNTYVFLSVCLLLFSLTFLAGSNRSFFGNIVAFHPWGFPNLPEGWRVFFPNLMTTFFHLYKTPEPQLSFLIQLLFFANLLSYTQTKSRVVLICLFALCLTLPFIYVTISLSLLVFLGIFSFLNMIHFRQRDGVLLFITSLFVLFYVCFFLFGQGLNDTNSSFIFKSHLPIITPSVFWGVLGIGGFIFYFKNKRDQIKQQDILALCCFIVPLFVLNQQIITGHMIQSRNWELYANYSYIAFGLLLMRQIWFRRNIQQKYMVMSCVVLALLLLHAQWSNYKRFSERNLWGAATAEVVDTLYKQNPELNIPIVLDFQNRDASVRIRTNDRTVKIFAGREMVFKEFLPRMTLIDDGYQVASTPYKDHGFTLFDKKAITPDQMQQDMESLIDRGLCMPYFMYFHSIGDCWYPFSDYREVRTEQIKKSIPNIVSDYQSFLSEKGRRAQFGDMIFITDRDLSYGQDVPWVSKELMSVTKGRYHSVRVRAFEHRIK